MKFTKEEIKTAPVEGGIYLFTNLVNDKRYVGQAVSLKKRLRSHLNNFNCSRYDNPLYRAINKYGIDNFSISIIVTIDIMDLELLKKILDKLEIFYIDKYDSYNNGYNQTKGGDRGILGYKMTEEQKAIIQENSKRVACDGRYFIYCKNIETNEIISDVNMSELASKLELNIEGVRTAKYKKRLYKGKYIFATSLEELKELEEKLISKTSNSKYDPTTEHNDLYLDYYNYLLTLDNPTIQQIADNLGLSTDTIKNEIKS